LNEEVKLLSLKAKLREELGLHLGNGFSLLYVTENMISVGDE